MSGAAGIYGLLAEFEDAESLRRAAERTREAGYRQWDAYSPLPLEELAEAAGLRHSPMPRIVLAGGLLGGIGGYALQYWVAVIHYPLNIGGKPLHSWPSFMPVTFECTILGAALAAVFGMFWINRLPMPWHPLFSSKRFERASQDRFFLCIKAADPLYEENSTRDFLGAFKPAAIEEVRA